MLCSQTRGQKVVAEIGNKCGPNTAQAQHQGRRPKSSSPGLTLRVFVEALVRVPALRELLGQKWPIKGRRKRPLFVDLEPTLERRNVEDSRCDLQLNKIWSIIVHAFW